MLNEITKKDLFSSYYREWIAVYKEGAVRNVTLRKYELALGWIEKLVPEMTVGDLARITYQKILNEYAKEYERQTTMDFHHLLKGAILDAVDEGLIDRDPTRKAIVKGKAERTKKQRYLNQFELQKLLSSLDLGTDIGGSYFPTITFEQVTCTACTYEQNLPHYDRPLEACPFMGMASLKQFAGTNVRP